MKVSSPVEIPLERRLASGRTLILSATESGEEIEIRSPEGSLELTITLGEQGPVVKLKGARLELESSDTVSIAARKLELKAEEHAELRSEGSLGLESKDNMRLLGKMIHIN